MIVFQSRDKKAEMLIKELRMLGIDGYALNPRLSILYPLKLLLHLSKNKNVKVYVFRYLNDSKSYTLSILRFLSDYFMVILLKIFRINIWWLNHNVDKETHENHPKITKLRRKLVSKNSSVIFTTNELLVPKALEHFPNNKIDYLSLGYIDGGIHYKSVDIENQNRLREWIDNRKTIGARFIFCIGRPAKKSLHFTNIVKFVNSLNENSNLKWYGVVVGGLVEGSNYIYNIPQISVLDKDFIRHYADYFYRIIDDYSMSYSTYEAVNFRIPLITEEFGILPAIIDKYKIGVVINSYTDAHNIIESYNKEEAKFDLFEGENNWKVAATKMEKYYNTI